MSIYLSKSRYCSGVQCPKILWLKKYKPDVFDDSVMNQAVLETGSEVGDLAMGLFGEFIEVPFGDLSEMIRITEELIEKKTPVIAEASFSYNGLFCSADILKRKPNGHFELYEVKSSTEVHDIYYHDVAYQVYVLRNLGYHVDKACLVHINSNYIRHGDLDLQKLFTIEDLSADAMAMQASVAGNIERFEAYLRKRKEPEKAISADCFAPYACGFFAYCSKELPSPSVFDLKNMTLNTKLAHFEKGLVSFGDLLDAGVLKPNPRMQAEHETGDLPDHIDPKQIRDFLSEITYPLYYLDFETFQPAVPLYDNSSPYEQIPFQYSLHYQKRKNGKLYHKEFLAYPGEDPRRALAERLVKDIPRDVCVLAYNMGFEKGRIKKLASLYPDLADHLMRIHDNIMDLMIPFQKRWYYTKAMQGSYSIKYVLPALFPDDPDLDYHNLEGVHNGQEASDTFRKMADMDRKTLEEFRTHLLKYCELDTFAMVKVLGYLENLQ